VTHDEYEEIVVFGSDVIDLSHIDFETLSEVPSTALRAAIIRVHEELSGNGDKSAVYADFRSSLRAMRAEKQRLTESARPDKAPTRYPD
jgi:hypothetical protein